MKITKVKYNKNGIEGGEVRFLIDEYPKTTFCIQMKNKTKKEDFLADLLAEIDKKKKDKDEEIFNTLDLISLEGEEI